VIGTVDFMITHIIAQELLFRGALVALAGRLWPPDAKKDGDASLVTLLVVSLVFGLAQLQYQESLLHSAPWWQVFRAFLVGLVMGVFRSSLRSVWASGCFHAFNNLIAAAR
jgi:membrane protease YdiL (CAAX protease family)